MSLEKDKHDERAIQLFHQIRIVKCSDTPEVSSEYLHDAWHSVMVLSLESLISTIDETSKARNQKNEQTEGDAST